MAITEIKILKKNSEKTGREKEEQRLFDSFDTAQKNEVLHQGFFSGVFRGYECGFGHIYWRNP